MAVYGGTGVGANPAVLDELADVKMSSLDLDCNVTEMAEIMNESMEATYNDLFKSVALEELATFSESGQIVVYEEGTLESFKNKIVDWFKKVWADIQKAYNTFLDKMDKMAKEFKQKMLSIAGGKDNAKDALAKFEDGKVYYRNYNFGTPGKEEAYAISAKQFDIEGTLDKLSKIKTDYENALKKESDNATTKAKSECQAAMKGVSMGIENPAAADIRKHVAAALLRVKTGPAMGGSATAEGGKNYGYTGKWIKDNYKGMVDYVSDFGAIKREVKRFYTDDKKKINKMIAEVKKTKREEPTKLFVTYAKKLISINNAVMSANMQYLGMKYNAYRAMVMRVIMGRVVKPKATKESAVGSFTSQQDQIRSLFSW